MRKLPSFIPVIVATAIATIALPAFGQNVGTLVGHVYDQNGTGLRGVTVAITSDTQIGGARTVTSDAEGGFRFPGLYPGRFRLTASAPQMRSVIQENIRITQGSTMEIDVVMEIETAQEEVKIVERAPVVNMQKASVGESFDADFLNSLPLQSRSYQGVAAMAAGASDRDGDGNAQIRGGTFFSNKYQVDGFDTTDPVTNTFGQLFSFNAIANVSVTTAGMGAEDSDTTGGVVNVVTKSGSNRFEFDSGIEYTDQNLRLFKDSRDRGSNRGVAGNFYVGGPIQKDRLWYATSIRASDTTFSLPYDPNFPVHPPYHGYGFTGTLKLTWAPTPRNKIHVTGSMSPYAFNNQLQSPLVEPEAEARQFQRTEELRIWWESLITDDLFLVGRLGYQQEKLDVGPQSCQWNPANCTSIPSETDVLTGIQRRNSDQQQIDHRGRIQFSGHLEYLKDTRGFGGHAARFNWSVHLMNNEVRQTVPGDMELLTIGSRPFRRTTYCSNDPKLDNGACRTNYLRAAVTGRRMRFGVQDSWKPTRYLTLTPGVAFHMGNSENDKGVTVTDMNGFTPHFQAIWDATHDGKTKLFGLFSGSLDTGFLALARFTSRRLYGRNCTWDEEAQAYVAGCISTGGNDATTVGLPCGPEGISADGQPCRSKLRPPRLWEYVAGAEREIATGIALGTVFTYRRFNNQWEDAETNANWNEGGTGLRREAPFKTGRSEFIFDLQTPDAAFRVNRSVGAYLRKQEGIIKAQANYTLQDYKGSADSSFAGVFLDNPGDTKYYYGPLAADYRHDLRLQGSYQMFTWLSMGVVYHFTSGGPYNRFFFDDTYGSFTRLQAQRGYDSRGNLNPDDDTPLRMPDLSSFDLQVRASLEPLIKQKIQIWADALNLLALRTTTAVIQQDVLTWGRPIGWTPPLRIRLGARYLF